MPKFSISFYYPVEKIGKSDGYKMAASLISSTMDEYFAEQYKAMYKKMSFSAINNTVIIVLDDEFSFEAHAITEAMRLKKFYWKIYKSLKWKRKFRGARMTFSSYSVSEIEEKKE